MISVLSNVDPWGTVALFEAASTGELERAQKLHDALMPLVDFLFSDSNPVPCKAAMSALGHCENRVRLPLAEGPLPDSSLLEGVQG
jgi:4-hydroxy-tetrahydrodipicolinate synthase